MRTEPLFGGGFVYVYVYMSVCVWVWVGDTVAEVSAWEWERWLAVRALESTVDVQRYQMQINLSEIQNERVFHLGRRMQALNMLKNIYKNIF